MMETHSERVVWIISEGSPGHVSQSVGLAEALSKRIPLRVERIECRLRLNGVARSVVRTWMGRKGQPLPDWMLKRWLRVDMSATTVKKPDLILSSGGKSVFVARSLAARSGAPYVFLGERKPYPSEWFHTVFTPSARENGMNDVQIEMIPPQVTKAGVERAAAAWTGRPSGRLWAMVIGGTSVSHRYADADWDALAAGMNTLARREGIRWLVTTSRRTGAEAEARLRTGLDASVVAAAVWWAEKPEKKMQAFLGAAECVFVTQDSVTMVTEAVASGRPVVVVRPELVVARPGGFMPVYFERMQQRGYIRRLRVGELAESTDTLFRCLAEVQPVMGDFVDYLAEVVMTRLKLAPRRP